MKSRIIDSLYNVTDAKRARSDLIAYIKTQAQFFESVSRDTFDAAYVLAGLMATDYVRSLPDEDPLVDILSIAGELEIDPPDSRQLADELIAKIAEL